VTYYGECNAGKRERVDEPEEEMQDNYSLYSR
jgi:hypothetical protein